MRWKRVRRAPPLLNHTVDYDPFIKVNLPHAINFGALCGANFVTIPSKLCGTETCEVHRAVGSQTRLLRGLPPIVFARGRTPPVEHLVFGVQVLGFRVEVLGLRVLGLGLEFRVRG